MDREKSIRALTLFTELAEEGEVGYNASWTIPYLIGKWDISNPYIKKVVGEEGKIEIPIDGLSSIGLHAGKFRRLVNEFDVSLRSVLAEFAPWEKGWIRPYLNTVGNFKFTHTSRLFLELLPATNELADRAPLKILKNARKTLDYFFHQMEKQNKKDFDKAIKEVKDRGRFSIYQKKIEYAKRRFNDLESFASQAIACNSGKLVISALPEDIVSASWNTFGWDSCTNPQGEYALTLLAQVRGESTLIAYVVGDDIPDFEEEGVTFSNKRWRAFIYVDDEGNFSMARHYPNNVPFLENKVWDVIKEKLEDPREITQEVGKIDFQAVYVDDRTSSLVRPGSSFNLYKTLYCYETQVELNSDDYGVISRQYVDGTVCCGFCGDLFDEDDNCGKEDGVICCRYCSENGELESWLRLKIADKNRQNDALREALATKKEEVLDLLKSIDSLQTKIAILSKAVEEAGQKKQISIYELLPDPIDDFCYFCQKYIGKGKEDKYYYRDKTTCSGCYEKLNV